MYFTQMFQVINLLLEFGNNLFFARLNNNLKIIKEEILMVMKDAIISMLMENPKYDSDWIDKASNIMLEFGLTEDELCRYSSDKLGIIEQAYKSYGILNGNSDEVFLDIIKNPEFNVTQMQILLTARSKGVPTEDIRELANPNISYGKMNYAAQAMINGFMITKEIVIQDYSIDQIYEIVAGYHEGVDYKVYANPGIPAEQMSVIRTALGVGYIVGYDISTKDISLIMMNKED